MALVASPAFAADTVTSPGLGLTLHEHVGGGQRWFVLTVDLTRKDLRLEVTPEQGLLPVSRLGARENAEVAINASFFCNGPECTSTPNYVCGTTLSRGTSYKKVYHVGGCYGSIGWSADAALWKMFLEQDPVPASIAHAASALWAVKDGQVCDGSGACSISSAPTLAPRTLLGVDRDRKRAFLVVIDGRDGVAAQGMSLRGAAAFMRNDPAVGAWDAMNFDGGGSSTLFLKGTGVVNVPSDGQERPVPNAIVVVRSPVDAGLPPGTDAGGAVADAGVPSGADAGDAPAGDRGAAAGPADEGGCSSASTSPRYGSAWLFPALLFFARTIVRRVRARLRA
jgi:hypothetical protein